MIDVLFLTFTYATEAMIVFLYAQSIYEQKLKSVYTCLIMLAAYMLLMIIYKYIINNEIVNLFLILIVNFSLLHFLFNNSLKSTLFHSIALLVLQLISEFLTAYITAFVLNITSQESITQHFESGVIISRIFYLLFSSILAKVSAKETRSKTWGRWYLLSLLPISSIFIISVFKSLTDTMSLNKTQNLISVIAISLLLVVNIIVYIIYEQAEKSSQKLIELEMTNRKNEIDLQYLNLLEKKNDAMQIMAHDYKNHIQTMESMATESDMFNYLESLKDEVNNYNNLGKTKNKILDVILEKYTDICKEKGIVFHINAISENLEFLSMNDISALFNNLLDNAIEAAEVSDKKYINMQISNVLGSYHKIIISNSSDIPPNTRNGKLITSKTNKNAHGFGTKSIERIVEKYKGELQWNYDESKKEFEMLIIIPIMQ